MPSKKTWSWKGPGLVLGLVLVLGLAACTGALPQSTLHPISDFGRRIDDLFRRIFWFAVGVFVVVEGLLVYAVFRFRDRGGEGRPEPVHGNTRLEIAWTLAPAVILVLIAVPTIRTIFVVDNPPPAVDNALPIDVIGHQWWWEFRYPTLGIVTADEMHVPVGRTVELHLTSTDVIHSFWVPRIGGKRDVVPGHHNFLWFTVDSAGEYPGQCAEFCGEEHALMRVLAIAQDSATFQTWADSQKPDAREPTDSMAIEGKQLVTNGICISCHTIRGTQAQGTIGPDLTHVGSRQTLVATILPNTPENMFRWIHNPDSVKPGTKMKIPQLPDDQIRKIVAYLQSLK
jgi:cytochrome c oxidase subunit 2